MERPAIPNEIKRSVFVEAGHRCAIPTCKYPTVDIHHIVPWEKCQRHDFDNLIVLCPNCHRRADSGEIDRKALRLYKAQLSASLGVSVHLGNVASSTIREVEAGKPGYEFEFEFPRFNENDLRPVELFLEAWGNQLLQKHRASQHLDPSEPDGLRYGVNTTSGSYEVVRKDLQVVSIKHRINRYVCGAAHGSGSTKTYTYLRNPLFELDFQHLLQNDESLHVISSLCREALLSDDGRDVNWVHAGTEPKLTSFESFNVTLSGLLITFDEYQVDCYAAGPQTVELSWEQIAGVIRPQLLRMWRDV